MKPKAPSWLTSAFAEGVIELAVADRPRVGPPYLGATGRCWLAQHDSHRQPCSDRLERFHFIGRQRVEAIMGERLVGCDFCDYGAIATEVATVVAACCGRTTSTGECCGEPVPEPSVDIDWQACPACEGIGVPPDVRVGLILLAAWDPRNAEVGCEGHHRRYDGHACSPRAPRIEVPALALPIRTVDFVFDWGLEGPAEDRFPGFNAALCDDRDAG